MDYIITVPNTVHIQLIVYVFSEYLQNVCNWKQMYSKQSCIQLSGSIPMDILKCPWCIVRCTSTHSFRLVKFACTPCFLRAWLLAQCKGLCPAVIPIALYNCSTVALTPPLTLATVVERHVANNTHCNPTKLVWGHLANKLMLSHSLFFIRSALNCT